ncbi:MAG: M23 family metallopeptidase [Angustibacter sp.]
MVRAILTALACMLPVVPGVAAPPPAAPRPASSGAEPRWAWPLDPQPAVAAPFQAPPTPWSAGHRGVDLTARVGQPVLSAATGRVSFSGVIAGRGVLAITHSGGLRTTYEPVTARLPIGTTVQGGQQVGKLAATPGHCAPQTCLHWGLRRGEQYLNPLAMISAGPPVLLPLSHQPRPERLLSHGFVPCMRPGCTT